jgi:hypothetical protein
MSQEPEDVKPKLNLNIAYEGHSSCRALTVVEPWLIDWQA